MLKKTQADVIKNAADNAKSGTGAASFVDEPVKKMSMKEKIGAFLKAYPIIMVSINLIVYAVVAGYIYKEIEGWDFIDGVRAVHLLFSSTLFSHHFLIIFTNSTIYNRYTSPSSRARPSGTVTFLRARTWASGSLSSSCRSP